MAAKIMLVEDDTNLSDIYKARLEAEGFEIDSAQDGEEALTLAVKEHPDLIISDVMMPKISGFDMLDILRGTEGIKNTKVIMMTALGQSEDKARAEKLGADRYLVKSQVTLEDVVKTVHDVLGDGPEPVVDDATGTLVQKTAAPASEAQSTISSSEPTSVTAAPAAALTSSAPAAPTDTATPTQASDAIINQDTTTVESVPVTVAPSSTPLATSSDAVNAAKADATSASDEQAAALSQIQEFLNTQEAANQPKVSHPSTTSSVTVTPPASAPASTSTPQSATAAPTSLTTSSPTEHGNNDTTTIAHKKVISPISNPMPKTDLSTLLAKEEGTSSTNSSTDGFFASSANPTGNVISPTVNADSPRLDPNKIAL